MSEGNAPRPFGLADAMILIVAVGLGLAGAQAEIGMLAELMLDSIGSEPSSRVLGPSSAVALLRRLNLVLLLFLLFLLVAFLIVRLRRPRPPLRLLFRQPG